jgi:hypothetical protein
MASGRETVEMTVLRIFNETYELQTDGSWKRVDDGLMHTGRCRLSISVVQILRRRSERRAMHDAYGPLLPPFKPRPEA